MVAYAGSDEWKDWPHNLGQGLGFQDAQYDQAIALAQEAKRAFGDNVVLTGQSLGGGLAAAASMVNDIPAVTFNAAGVHDKTLERYGFDADVLKREAEQGLIRTYHVKNEILTHLQEDSIPLKWAMPDAPGHKIELPDPDPLTFFERLVPGKMLMHRVDLHFIEAVMEAQDLAQLQVRERNPGAGPGHHRRFRQHFQPFAHGRGQWPIQASRTARSRRRRTFLQRCGECRATCPHGWPAADRPPADLRSWRQPVLGAGPLA